MNSVPGADPLVGLPFVKMTGSGNDFVFFDARQVPLSLVTSPEAVRRICHRHNGIGADGVVVLEPTGGATDVRVHYFNSDGSPADLCGNATLCSTALSAAWGMTSPSGMALETGAGAIASRLKVVDGGQSRPAIDLQAVTDIRSSMPIELGPNEIRAGFAVAGIPHLVLLTDDVDLIDLPARGPGLRWHASTGAAGANVNWVSPLPEGGWRYRTFERGVEGETLACGTGAVATAVLLARWGLAELPEVVLQTRSGLDLRVTLADLGSELRSVSRGEAAGYRPTLSGEGREVFRGTIGSLGPVLA
jgi:diaminopimelate epimerase